MLILLTKKKPGTDLYNILSILSAGDLQEKYFFC